MIPLKIDLHIHTTHSGDSLTTVKEAVEWAERRGLDGIAITDHNSVDALEEIPRLNSGLLVLLGEEIDTREGHLIALGINEKIPSGLSFSKTLGLIRQVGGLAVVPHPFDRLRGGVGPKVVRSFTPDALEVVNSHSLFFGSKRDLGISLAQELGLPCVGGSDSHVPETIGDAYTLVSCGRRSQDSVLKSIRGGRTQVFGSPTAVWHRLRTLPLVFNKV